MNSQNNIFMEKKHYIVLLSVHSTDRVEHAEMLQNMNFEIDKCSGCEVSDMHKVQAKISLKYPEIRGGGVLTNFLVLSLSNFMDYANDEEINLEDYWISYVTSTYSS